MYQLNEGCWPGGHRRYISFVSGQYSSTRLHSASGPFSSIRMLSSRKHRSSWPWLGVGTIFHFSVGESFVLFNPTFRRYWPIWTCWCSLLNCLFVLILHFVIGRFYLLNRLFPLIQQFAIDSFWLSCVCCSTFCSL